jgi:hypothetical protein
MANGETEQSTKYDIASISGWPFETLMMKHPGLKVSENDEFL